MRLSYALRHGASSSKARRKAHAQGSNNSLPLMENNLTPQGTKRKEREARGSFCLDQNFTATRQASWGGCLGISHLVGLKRAPSAGLTLKPESGNGAASHGRGVQGTSGSEP